MSTPPVAARQAEAWPVWRCPSCDWPNDNLRHTCRPCGAHRPCEHVAGGSRCGAVPVHMYPDGPKCAGHGPAQPDTGRLAAGPDAAELGGAFTVGQWAGSVVAAWERTPRDLLGDDGQSRPNPGRETARKAARNALATLAGHLGAGSTPTGSRVGPCLGCPAWTLRYGDGGGPLCPACREALDKARARSACP